MPDQPLAAEDQTKPDKASRRRRPRGSQKADGKPRPLDEKLIATLPAAALMTGQRKAAWICLPRARRRASWTPAS